MDEAWTLVWIWHLRKKQSGYKMRSKIKVRTQGNSFHGGFCKEWVYCKRWGADRWWERRDVTTLQVTGGIQCLVGFRATVSTMTTAAACHRYSGQPKSLGSSCLDRKATGHGIGTWKRTVTTQLPCSTAQRQKAWQRQTGSVFRVSIRIWKGKSEKSLFS